MIFSISHAFPAGKRREGIILPSPASLLFDSVRLYFRKFFLFLFILGIPALLFFVFSFAVVGMAGTEASRITPGVLFSPAVFFGVVFFGAVVLLFQIWGGVALLLAICSEGPERLFHYYVKTFPKIGSYAWIIILMYLVGLAGFSFFILPGVYLLVSISFALFVFFSDGVKGFGALTRSFSLVKGNWWGVFFRIFVVYLLGAGFFFFLRYLFLSFFSLVFASVIVNVLLFFVAYPLGLLYVFRLFTVLRRGKPWVFEEVVHDRVFIFIAFLGLVLLFTMPLLAVRGVSRFFPQLYFRMFDIERLFAFSIAPSATAVRSGPHGEELFALQRSRDEKRLSDIATFSFVFDSIVLKNPSFCAHAGGGIFKSTAGSGGGTSWLPIDLAREGIEGPVVTHTPRDPVNTSRYHYSFACSSDGKYEINVRLESSLNVSKSVSDGGNNEEAYEVGTNFSLIP